MSEAKVWTVEECVRRGLVDDMSSEDYHGLTGTYSSSQLKDAEDPELFYKKYISREIEKESIPAFNVGQYFHTMVLEPHKVKDECVVYDGVRRGEKWEAFKAKHTGKAILIPSEQAQAVGLVKAVQDSPIAMGRIKRGNPEVSAFLEILVDGSEIYTADGKLRLGFHGWETAKSKPSKKAIKIVLKVRADLLADDFILDLKSTSGNAKNRKVVRTKVSDYSYDLSAALYLDVFSVVTGKTISCFIWTFASKDHFNCKSWMASDKNILIGRAKWKKAVIALADGIATNWEIEDSMGILEPSPWEHEHIEQKGEDLL